MSLRIYVHTYTQNSVKMTSMRVSCMNLQPTLFKSSQNRIQMSQKKQIVERCKGNLSSASLCGQNGIFEKKKHKICPVRQMRETKRHVPTGNDRVCNFVVKGKFEKLKKIPRRFIRLKWPME